MGQKNVLQVTKPDWITLGARFLLLRISGRLGKRICFILIMVVVVVVDPEIRHEVGINSGWDACPSKRHCAPRGQSDYWDVFGRWKGTRWPRTNPYEHYDSPTETNGKAIDASLVYHHWKLLLFQFRCIFFFKVYYYNELTIPFKSRNLLPFYMINDNQTIRNPA